MFAHLFHYYGLDWGDAILSMMGIYFLGRKNKIGFLCNATGALCGLILFIILSSLPFIMLNAFLICLNLMGYVKWKKTPNN